MHRPQGFIWIATSQFFMGAWQQAGNVLKIEPARPWLCEIRHMWEGTPSEPAVMKELLNENGEVKNTSNKIFLAFVCRNGSMVTVAKK